MRSESMSQDLPPLTSSRFARFFSCLRMINCLPIYGCVVSLGLGPIALFVQVPLALLGINPNGSLPLWVALVATALGGLVFRRKVFAFLRRLWRATQELPEGADRDTCVTGHTLIAVGNLSLILVFVIPSLLWGDGGANAQGVGAVIGILFTCVFLPVIVLWNRGFARIWQTTAVESNGPRSVC